MSNTISGGISFSGIGSGTDFSAMIEQLKEVESFRLYSLQDSRDVATETYEAFQDLIKTVTEAKESLSLLNTYEEFLTKIASSSSEATLGVKADANAVDGTHKIEVKQLASNAIWANKGSYPEKTTVINSTGAAEEFSYTYKGETRTLSVPAGTTLEGFANMVNQDRANPGVRVSILKTADGYSFQVSGDESGAAASLEIHPSGLMGLSGEGGTWESSASVDMDTALNAGNVASTYSYSLKLDGIATPITVNGIDGASSQQDLVNAINAADTRPDDIASIDADGNLVIKGLESMDITTTSPDGVESAENISVKRESTIDFAGALTEHTIAGPASYSFTAEGSATPVVVNMTGGHTQKDVLDKLAEEGYEWTSTSANGRSEVVIEGITGVPSNFLDTDLSNRGSVPVSSFMVDTAGLQAEFAAGSSYSFATTGGGSVSFTMDTAHTATDVLNKLSDLGYASSGSAVGDTSTIGVTGISDMSALTSKLGAHNVIDAKLSTNINMLDVGEATFAAKTYEFRDEDNNLVSISMADGHTQDDLLTALEEHTPTSFPSTVTDSNGRRSITIYGLSDASALFEMDPAHATGATATTALPDYSEAVGGATETVQSGVVPTTSEWVFTKEDGSTFSVAVSNTDTMRDVLERAKTEGPMTYSHDATTGIVTLDGITSVSGMPGEVSFGGSLTGSDAWQVQASQDAIFKVDNWPQDLTSSTNEVQGVLEGITLSLRDVGTAQITVAADTDSVKANIQTVLDAINSVLKKVQDLTAITEDVSDSYDDSAQSVAQTSGSALTGNYSTQLFLSRFKSEAASHPPGFQPMTADDIFSGDFISSLAQMGIKVSSDVDDPNFGLFSIAPQGTTESIQALDQAAFDDAIAKNLEDVINFFAASEEGTSSSANFRYNNHIDGLTQPGTYDVSYTVDASGNPINVFINGALASPSENDPNTFSAGSGSGDAGGMAITIDNLAPGSYSGSVSVQQGKVGQLEAFLAAELKYVTPNPSDASMNQKNGGLQIAAEGAKSLIEQLDTKIGEESDRLERWEETERLKFARLDTLLGTYNGQMEMLAQQIGQLG